MTTQQQAYINGFIKRAADYGYSEEEAAALLKSSAWEGTGFHGSRLYNAIYGDPSKPAPAAPAPREASVPSYGNMGGLGGGIGAGFGQIAHNPEQVQSAPITQQSNPNRGNEFFAGTGFHGSRLYNSLYGDPSKPNTPAKSNVGDRSGEVGGSFASTDAVNPTQTATPSSADLSVMNAPTASNPFTNNVSLGLSGGTSPQAVKPALQPIHRAVSQPPAREAQGPSNAALAKIMGSYDPRSRLDQAKAQRIREMYSQGKTSPNAIYADKAYSGITPQSLRSGAIGAKPQALPRVQRPQNFFPSEYTTA